MNMKPLLLMALTAVAGRLYAQLPDTTEKTFEPVLTAPVGSNISGTNFKLKLHVTGNGLIHSSARFYSPEVISNPGNNSGQYYAAHFAGPILVENGALINEIRTNSFRWKTDATISFAKPNTNLPSLMVIKTMGMVRTANALSNGLLLQDSVAFITNTAPGGFNALQVNPLITQTGYSGITRGVYVNPVLTDVANFRAVETNVPWGSGYQIYAGGEARNYFRGATTADSNWVFASNVYLNGHTFGKILRSNAFAYSEAKAMEIQKYANPSTLTGTGDVLRIYAWGKSNLGNINWNGVGIYDTLVFNQNVSSGRISALRLSPAVVQTGFTGSVKGLLIDPALTDVTDFRAIQTEVAAGKGYQLYAAGTAPSYFGGNVGIGTWITGDYKLAVEGTIGARRVKVHTTSWADYVFDSSYTLAPLQAVEKYILENKHLPEVPAAATVAREGVDVGENQVLLLKKIEELTLYIIEQNKRIEAQGQQLQQQGEEIRQLKAKRK